MESPSRPEAPQRDDPPRRLVLVVEDEPQVMRFLRATLTAHEYRLVEATTGQQALLEAATRSPDLVILDLGLPDLDGYQVARALRAEAALRSTYLVALSGYAQAEDIRRSLDAGFDAHLGKPAPLDQLHALLASERPVPEDRPPAAGDL